VKIIQSFRKWAMLNTNDVGVWCGGVFTFEFWIDESGVGGLGG